MKRIIPMNKCAPYLKAIELTVNKGGFPSNVLHDDYLVRSDNWKLVDEIYPAWAREMVVYPEKGGKFQKGRDVVDSKEDENGRKWILSANQIPEEAIGRENVGLFVDPEEVLYQEKRVVILPKSVVVLSPFIQENLQCGKVDEDTRIPLLTDPEKKLNNKQKRWLMRSDGIGVKPLVRCVIECYDRKHHIYTFHSPDEPFGVAYVSRKDLDLKKESPIDGVTMEEFKVLVENADVNLKDISGYVKPTKLQAIRRLIQALKKIKQIS